MILVLIVNMAPEVTEPLNLLNKDGNGTNIEDNFKTWHMYVLAISQLWPFQNGQWFRNVYKSNLHLYGIYSIYNLCKK